MIIIFDLDHTLLNAEKVKLAISRIFKLSRRKYDASCHELFGRQSDLYNPFIHLNLLVKTGEINVDDIRSSRQKIKELLVGLNIFIVPGAEDLLKQLKQKKHFLILISHGNVGWQKNKIKHLIIKKYFKKIIVTDKNKADSYKFLQNKKEGILIINDNARENKEILALLPKARGILIKSIHSDNIRHNYREYSFKQAIKLLIDKY